MLTQAEKEAIQKYFGKPIEELNEADFRHIRKQLRAKYHPDNFEKFEDQTVREMATERFQAIEKLSEKVLEYYSQSATGNSGREKIFDPKAQFAFDKLKIEVITSDKDLKYNLFGTFYRWLVYGDTFKIPNTKASIIMDENHQGTSIGYRETIRFYLTFGVDDAVEDLVDWLFSRIQDRASSLIIHGDIVQLDRDAILRAIKKTTFLQIGTS